MTKKQIVDMLYKKIYNARQKQGYFARRNMDSPRTEAELYTLLEIAEEMKCSPVFKDWYIKAFNDENNIQWS